MVDAAPSDSPATSGDVLSRVVMPAVVLVGTAAVTVWLSAQVETTWVEYGGYLSGVACVWLTMRNRVSSWPVGLVNCVFLFAVFWRARLFADMWLQAVYFALGVIGWWMWVRYRGQRVERPTQHARPRTVLVVAAAVLVGWAVMYWYFSRFTSAASPLWDSLLTSGSLGAQYLLMRRLVENWGFWVSVDVAYVVLFWSRHLHITSVLYVVFLVMSLNGWRDWIRQASPVPVPAP
ncbi:MAG: nicotinamide mononucleotide transporter [Actinobacteria bacterium]|nr:nicotinamide mononucleotide transporter [Actinomycetota bacterium]